MKSPRVDPPPEDFPCRPPEWPSHPAVGPREPRNLILLAAHQIVLRVGWIFKTESVMMPAFLDQVAGAGWVRGCLPVLNRLGQSVPPVFSADYLRAMPYKKRALVAFTMLMGLPLGALSIAWFAVGGENVGKCAWMPGLFLALYFTFFVLYGLYLVSFGTVQGKLIRPTRRGCLLLVSTALGTIPAMVLAWWLLADWLNLPGGGFGYIFGFTAVCFFLSGLTALLLSEPGDEPGQPTADRRAERTHAWQALRQNLADTRRVLLRDRNLQRLVIVAMLFGSSLIILPHYQNLALKRLGLPRTSLMVFVIVQNAAVGSYALIVGPLADAWGNRLTLRTLIFGAGLTPPLAILLANSGESAAKLYWMVFIPLGVSPLVLRILINYTLEICEPAEHPRYLSTVNLCLAVPFLFSPVVGWLVDATSFELVFLTTVCLVALSGWLTFRLEEPRHRLPPDDTGTVGVGPEP